MLSCWTRAATDSARHTGGVLRRIATASEANHVDLPATFERYDASQSGLLNVHDAKRVRWHSFASAGLCAGVDVPQLCFVYLCVCVCGRARRVQCFAEAGIPVSDADMKAMLSKYGRSLVGTSHVRLDYNKLVDSLPGSGGASAGWE